MSNGNFGIQVAKKIVLGAAASAGLLAPFVITGIVVKRKIRKTINKKTDDFFTSLMKTAEEIKKNAANTVMDSVVDIITDDENLSPDAMTQSFDNTAGEKE